VIAYKSAGISKRPANIKEKIQDSIMGLSERNKFILSASSVVFLVFGSIIALTIGLYTPPLENGGSPPYPANWTTQMPDTTEAGQTTVHFTTQTTTLQESTTKSVLASTFSHPVTEPNTSQTSTNKDHTSAAYLTEASSSHMTSQNV